MELPLVQILVEVAITMMKPHRMKESNGFKRMAFVFKLNGPKKKLNCSNMSDINNVCSIFEREKG